MRPSSMRSMSAAKGIISKIRKENEQEQQILDEMGVQSLSQTGFSKISDLINARNKKMKQLNQNQEEEQQRFSGIGALLGQGGIGINSKLGQEEIWD